MYVPFNELSEDSKIWIYQSEREFTDSEIDLLKKELETFATEWTVHSQTLKSSFSIHHNHFIILAVDESLNEASGCSIDSSSRFIKSLGARLSIDFFKRENLAFLIKNQIKILPLNLLKQSIISKKITKQSIFFNNLAGKLKDLDEKWRVSASETWLNNYFN